MKYSKPKPRSAIGRAWCGALLVLTSCASGLAACLSLAGVTTLRWAGFVD